MSANHRGRRKTLAIGIGAVLLLSATAAQARPPETTTVTLNVLRDVEGYHEEGIVTVREDPTGAVSLTIDITRTQACPGGSSVSRSETWRGTTTTASLTVANNLSSATASGTFTSGYSLTSSCEGETGNGAIGEVLIEGLATDRATRERTSDGVRRLTRTADLTATWGFSAFQGTGAIVKDIG
ncbi:MAG TPA: hypothetical protein VLA54_03390 [Acidimicrobiia bacterium]|nr:hypothetical protein [Acidimicrobiia bacterium]